MLLRRTRPRVVNGLINVILSFIIFIVSLRLLLRFLGANTSAPFVRWIYETSDPLLSPFRGMFPAPRVDGFFVLEISSLFALVVYAFLGYLLQEMVDRIASIGIGEGEEEGKGV